MRQSAWIAVQYKKQFLLLQRGKKANNPKLWNLPGGGVEKGELPKKTVIRELWEEAGIKVRDSQVEFLKRVTAGGRQMFFYRVVFPTKPKVTIDFESKNYKWLKLKDFPKKKKLHYQTGKFVKHSDKFDLELDENSLGQLVSAALDQAKALHDQGQ